MTNSHATSRTQLLRSAQRLCAQVGGIFAVIFVLITALVASGATAQWDLSITEGVVAHRNAFFNAIFPVITSFGGTTVVMILAAVSLGILAFKRRWLQVKILFGALAGDVIIVTAIKRAMSRLRPDASFWLGTVEDQQSFPSGHSANNTVLWLTLAIIVVSLATTEVQRKWARAFSIFAVILPVLIGISRVYVAQHWVTDVLGGWSLGIAWTALVAWVYYAQLAKLYAHKPMSSPRLSPSQS
ncbi:phosphatase PAP2 family protein [Alloscardovia criceti]|uniref:phosphatase PAP2 family protein n=1 Tax=Alloscardovia criceti TaxID=356828 RepID=UPI0003663239|nr:phosphatase PAP2 family protein [Alloscardovia criceti]